MKAVVRDAYGPPEVLRTGEVADPSPRDDEVLVRVIAAGVNPGDWDVLRGTPYLLRPMTGLRRPRHPVLGLAVAGRVEACGRRVQRFDVGDEVYAGIGGGGFAEVVCIPQDAVAAKPPSLSFAQAAAVPVTGVAALQALRDVAQVLPGQRVLVTGASGGVGTFAVQIARALGAEVTGVCSSGNRAFVRDLGADHVIGYDQEDVTTTGRRYDVILDNVGNRSLAEMRRVLAPHGVLIPNSNKAGGRWVGGYLRRAGLAVLVSPFVSQRLRPFASTDSAGDLDVLTELIEAGKVRPVVDRAFPLQETAEALRFYGRGHTRGKVVITVGAEGPGAHHPETRRAGEEPHR